MKKKILFAVAVLGAAGAMTAALTANALQPLTNAEGSEYTVVLNEAYWKSRSLSGAVGSNTVETQLGNPIGFTANSWVEYTPDGWGCFASNGAHWDGEIHSTTAITGIKKIEAWFWFNIFGYDETGKTPYVCLTTAADASFKTDAERVYLRKGEGEAHSQYQAFVLDNLDSPSYWKVDFGDDSGNTFFTGIERIAITYSCEPAPEKATITMNAPWAYNLGKFSGQMGTWTLTGTDGDAVGMSANQWVEYTPDGWGCFATNGQHWDGEFHNTTALKNIKKVNFRILWNIFNATTAQDPQIINITTATDANFTQGVKKSTFTKTGSATATGVHDTFELKVKWAASFFKLDFGDSATNAGFHGIESFVVTYEA